MEKETKKPMPEEKSSLLRDKKIIIVLGWLEMGGAERQALHIARHLAHEQGARVEVLGFVHPGEVARRLDELQIPWRMLPWPTPPGVFARSFSMLRLTLSLRASKPDLILPYIMQASLFCGLIWRLTGARACFWNQRDEGRNVRGSRLERWVIRRLPGVLSNSRHAAEMLIEKFDLDRSRVRVIYNGVRPEAPQAAREEWRERLELDSKYFVACMVANLHAFKDHDTLLRAWRIVLDRRGATAKDAMLLLAGLHNETSQSLQELAAELELGANLRFLGGVKDVSGLLGAIDLGVFSSRCEGVPNGVLECMAEGLAVAGTDIPGIREALGPGSERFLAPPGDAEILAERILELWNDADLRREVGRANRERIESVFTPERLCRETVEVLEAALQKRSISSHDAT